MFCSKKKTSRVFSCLILFRNCLFRLHPFQELSCQNGSFSGTVFSDWILFRNCFEQISYITCHDVSISKHRAQDPLQELSSETYPFQEVSLQNISFAGTVLRNHILCRNCLCKPYPLQELSLQTVSFTGTTFTDQILHTQELSFRTSVVKKKIFLGTITFPGKHLCNSLFQENIPQGI